MICHVLILYYLSQQDCKSPTSFPCETGSTCEIGLFNNVEIDDCNGQIADYLAIEYRYIPCKQVLIVFIFFSAMSLNFSIIFCFKVYSSKNFSICSNALIDATSNSIKYGIITTPNYPNTILKDLCSSIIKVDSNKIIRAYITDLNTESGDPDTGE